MLKKSKRIIFKLVYTLLGIITILAVATPPAIAANILPDTNTGAFIMLLAIAILMLTLVVEIWRQTARNIALPMNKPDSRGRSTALKK